MIYKDALLPYMERLRQLSQVELRRATKVEPNDTGVHPESNWYVDFTVMGAGFDCQAFHDEDGEPFRTRAQALAYEEKIVNQYWVRQGLPN